MKQLPIFFEKFISYDPALAEGDFLLGLGTFPGQHNFKFYAPNGQSSNSQTWQEMVDATWRRESKDKVGLYDAIDDAIIWMKHEFETKPVSNIHLVIFGDGMIDYGNGNEWPKLMEPQDVDWEGEGDDPQWLQHRLSEAGVHLHYVYYECLSSQPNADLAETLENNFMRWSDIQGLQLDNKRDTFGQDEWIKVYRWGEDGPVSVPIQKDGETVTLEAGTLDDLLQLTLGEQLLPKKWGSANGLEGQQGWLVPAGTSLAEVKISLPGTALDVTVHTVGLDTRIVMAVEDSRTFVGNDYQGSFEAKLTTKEGCSGYTLQFGRKPLSNSREKSDVRLDPVPIVNVPDKLKYPLFIWWDVTELAPGTLRVTLENASQIDGTVAVKSQSSVYGEVDWEPGTINLEDLKQCYRLDVVTSETPSSADNKYVEGLDGYFNYEFDPENPVFDPRFKVIAYRHDTMGVPQLQEGYRDKWIANEIPFRVVHFSFEPTLKEDANLQPIVCSDNTKRCVITIPLDFAIEGYYPQGAWPGDPTVYVLAEAKFKDADSDCHTLSKSIDKESETDPPIGEKLFYQTIQRPNGSSGEESNALLAGQREEEKESLQLPSDQEDGDILLILDKNELEACGIDYLYILWRDRNDQDTEKVTEIYCSFAHQTCLQTPELTDFAGGVGGN